MQLFFKVAGLLILISAVEISQLAAASSVAARSPSKNDLVKRCMLKNMSARRELQYNDAAKECLAQVELQSNAATQAPQPAKS